MFDTVCLLVLGEVSGQLYGRKLFGELFFDGVDDCGQSKSGETGRYSTGWCPDGGE